jgi:hypothetical protein
LLKSGWQGSEVSRQIEAYFAALGLPLETGKDFVRKMDYQ